MSESTPITRQKLKRLLRQLSKVRGRHTELVSVYIPAGYDINKIVQHLQQEQGTASNIKDKNTQQKVIDSLERMIRHLRLYKNTPKNGLAVFSGNVSDTEAKIDIQVYSVEPPEPLNMRLYRCDQKFVLDTLQEYIDSKDVYGIIVLDKREGNVGYLKGTSIQEVANMTSGVPGKTKAGGQCLHPDTCVHLADGQFLRIEEIEVGDEVLSYDFKTEEFGPSKILDKWETKKNKIYSITAGEKIMASGDHVFFLVDGTEISADKLKFGQKLFSETKAGVEITHISFEEKEIPLIDIKVEKENFIAEGILVHNSAQRFARLREEAAKEFFKRISEACNKAFLGQRNLKGILVGGPGMTKNKFIDKGFLNEELKRKVISMQDLSYTGSFGMRELVDKSQDQLEDQEITIERKIVEKFLMKLSKDSSLVTYGSIEVEKALEAGAVETLLVSESIEDDLVEKYEDLCEETGTEFRLISTDTPEGMQLKDLGKIAAILRFSFS
jgi:peptide subunit release factor 1 (eRF1)